ncbi:phosphoethanolamine--lipid A transferase [Thalassomonas viridans]|uniref:Phosphoethanolamine--lipid A transferase n=1 Tax=Thalassomonas viridans TaxID=137584 RepID=A0AAE9Z4I1_9GAMM|nr:phosphoethanolamine--lipid A transferase [Thalassomonas viridans]WDE06157.1 phosphoethanolamine--lipid A transferase [Thalassomonas viridans]
MARLPKIKLNHNVLLLTVMLLVCAFGNNSFLSQASFVYPLSDNLGFIIALCVVAFLVSVILTLLFSLVMPLKAALAIMLLVSASAGYFVDDFGVVIDDVMIQNLFETNSDEVLDLLSWGLVLRIVLLALAPAALLSLVELPEISRPQLLLKKTKLFSVSVLTILLLLGTFSSHFTTFFREHKPLRFYLNPIYPLYSFGYYVNSQLANSQDRNFVTYALESRSEARPEAGQQPNKLVIVVVGETVRADNLQFNGYNRATMPLLSLRDDIINFSNYSSCGTSTAISVPCMFSFDGKEDFDISEFKYKENALDVLAKSGVSVLWRDNNSSSKGVADRVSYESFKSPELNRICDLECRDIGMLDGLQNYLEQNPGDVLIVLHQMGNHGPAYYKRYPKSFERFTPACQTNELSRCSDEEIVNAYDNALLYTDYFLSQTLAFLEKNSGGYQTAMLYISDHGESLGENGIYLHGMPYFLAPKQQTHVPMLAWFSDSFPVDPLAVQNASSDELSHDSFSYSLIDLFDVSLLGQSSPYPVLFRKNERLASASGNTSGAGE